MFLQKSPNVPFKRMTQLDSGRAAVHGESVRLDSGLSLPVEEVARGVDAVNQHIRDANANCCC